MLVLIDFEKAVDSISWSLIYKVLNYFGFGNYIIQWVKIPSTNFKVSVLQNVFFSNYLSIASYLFLLCSEILSILIKQNNEMEGNTIGSKDLKINQYADDKSFILDGSHHQYLHL